MWKTIDPVTSHRIFVYPLHLFLAKIATLVTSHVLAVRSDAAIRISALPEHCPSKVCRSAETEKVTVWESSQFLTSTQYCLTCMMLYWTSHLFGWPPVAMVVAQLALCWKLLALPLSTFHDSSWPKFPPFFLDKLHFLPPGIQHLPEPHSVTLKMAALYFYKSCNLQISQRSIKTKKKATIILKSSECKTLCFVCNFKCSLSKLSGVNEKGDMM